MKPVKSKEVVLTGEALIWDTTFFFVNCQRRSIPNILPSYILKYVYHFSARSYRQLATEKTPNLDRMIQAMIQLLVPMQATAYAEHGPKYTDSNVYIPVPRKG